MLGFQDKAKLHYACFSTNAPLKVNAVLNSLKIQDSLRMHTRKCI